MKPIVIYILLILATGADAQVRNLDYYIEQAKTASPLLKDFRNQILANGTDSEMVRASYKVQVNGISNDFYAPVVGGVGYDQVITNGAQVTAQVQASKSIVSGNNLATQFKNIHLQNQSIGNTSAIAEKDLKKTITAQ